MRFSLSRLFFECIACREPLPNPRAPVCEACLTGLIPAPALCPACGALDCWAPATGECAFPELPLLLGLPLREVRARYIGAGSGYTILKRWKRGQGRALEELLLPRLGKLETLRADPDSRLMPIPQRLERSYTLGGSPAWKVAAWISARTGIPVEEGSWRSTRGSHRLEGQTAELGLARRLALKPRFEWADPRERAPRHVILVDDVLTSGKTLRDAAQELARAGTESFSVSVLAIRARPGSRPGPSLRSGAERAQGS